MIGKPVSQQWDIAHKGGRGEGPKEEQNKNDFSRFLMLSSLRKKNSYLVEEIRRINFRDRCS